MTQDQNDDIDIDELAERVAQKMDTGRIGDTDRFMLSRRQLVAIAGSGLGAGALGALGIGEASAQNSGQAGTIGTRSSPVDVEAQDINSATITNSGQVTTQDLNVTGSATGVGAKEFTSIGLAAKSGTSPVPFDTANFDPNGNFSSSNNGIVVPETGVYIVSFGVAISSGASTGTRAFFKLAVGGVTSQPNPVDLRLLFEVADGLERVGRSGVVNLNAGDVLTLKNDSGTSLQGTPERTQLSIIKIS
jgi:hypothetical protein